MKSFIKYVVCFILLAQGNLLFSQQEILSADKAKEPTFTVKGSVYEKDSREPISQVNIEINGGQYTTTNFSGEFVIQAKKGDELVIRHKDFETVYYSIKNDEDIRVEVQEQEKNYSKMRKKMPLQKRASSFYSLIDSAKVYVKTDAEKSIQFITEALSQSVSISQNSDAYETLADVYLYWNQFDLAVTNYEISLQSNSSSNKKLKLANALKLNKNYQESLVAYAEIDENILSNYQKIELHEGIGDVNKSISKYDEAVKSYQKGLLIAQKHLVTPKITDLNSKIAEVYAASGNLTEAQGFFTNSLDLANKENKKRALEEKVKVADFQNTNRSYSDEIELRKDALKDIEEISEDEEILDNSSPLTLQKQNYKIGNAYILQKNYDEAIPYLEKSIKEADSKEDIVVQKDATRRLSEVYRDIGDYNKALLTYQQYVDLVDQDYIKKEQEISQAARFNRDIANKQNRITSLETDRQLSQSIYELSNEQNKRQKLIIYSLIGGLLLLLVTAYFMYKYIKQQKLANNLLALKSLRSQMNPHFIFNALNSVNSFIATNDERTANKYLSDFSQLMRSVLENSEEDFIPLEKEIELLELYTKLEHFRFKDKFEYNIKVDENVNINEFQIPPMLLQPYIENAVWHGLRYKTEKGKLDINIVQKTKDEIAITIIDDGVGRVKSKALKTENQQKQNSKGMGNIKKRVSILNEMYKDKVDVFIDDFQQADDTGTKVVVTIKKD